MRSAAGCQRNAKRVLSTIFVVLDLPVRVIPKQRGFLGQNDPLESPLNRSRGL
jgi:hypothetical protein